MKRQGSRGRGGQDDAVTDSSFVKWLLFSLPLIILVYFFILIKKVFCCFCWRAFFRKGERQEHEGR